LRGSKLIRSAASHCRVALDAFFISSKPGFVTPPGFFLEHRGRHRIDWERGRSFSDLTSSPLPRWSPVSSPREPGFFFLEHRRRKRVGGSANNPLTLPCTVGWLAEASNVPQHAGASCFCGDQLTSLRDGDPQGHPFKWLDREASVTRWPGLFSKRGPLRLCDTLKPQPRISAISAVSKVGSFARFKLSTI
jgi:hypothetical protein